MISYHIIMYSIIDCNNALNEPTQQLVVDLKPK